MISLVVAAVLLLIHALVCLMLWTLMKLGLLPVRGHMLAVIVLVPLWGPLLMVLLSVRSAVFGEGLKESALESLRFNDELHRSMWYRVVRTMRAWSRSRRRSSSTTRHTGAA